MFEKNLFGLNKDGSFKVWSIKAEDSYNGLAGARLIIVHGSENGKLTEKKENVLEGKQGRTPYEQAVSQAEGRIKKQMDKGYRETKEELQSLPLLPMLASDYLKVGHRIEFPCYTSVKYDGVRCLATKHAGEVQLQSRTGQLYSVPHIEESLKTMMKDGDVYDGELYLHGYELQDITSAVKRTNPYKEIESALKKHKKSYSAAGLQQNPPDYEKECENAVLEARKIKHIRENMEFHIFDVPTDEPFNVRLEELDNLFSLWKHTPYINFTQYDTCFDGIMLKRQHVKAVKDGFEGLMLRNQLGKYESGKRSADLQKYKEFLDEEFEILDIVPDKQGDGVFVLRNNQNDLTFQCVMGTLRERNDYRMYKSRYIGKWLKVKFQTRYKGTLLPQFPVGLMIREGYAVNGSFVPFD